MRIKIYSIIFFIFIISCSTSIEKASFKFKKIKPFFVHSGDSYLIKIPENWNFLSQKDEIDIQIKFTSEDKRINGYLKRFPFRRKLYNLKTVVRDYFSKRDKCDFDNIYVSNIGQTYFYLLQGYFRDVYPIVTIVFLIDGFLYELTITYIVTKKEIETHKISGLLKKLVFYSKNIFASMKFFKDSRLKYRKRYGITVFCPKDWVFGLSTNTGEISSLGYKDKIVLVSLKLLRNYSKKSIKEITNKMLRIRLEFLKEMKAKKYEAIQRTEKIFGVSSLLTIFTNIPTESRNSDEETYSVVKKYYFIKNKKIFELLVVYSMKDVSRNIHNHINKVLSMIKFS